MQELGSAFFACCFFSVYTWNLIFFQRHLQAASHPALSEKSEGNNTAKLFKKKQHLF